MADHKTKPHHSHRPPIGNLAIIPARGGSKGAPGKNLRLLPRCIDTAKRASSIDHIIVSTDDMDIASLAEECGAEVIIRPDELCQDDSSSESALLHVLDSIEQEPKLITMLQCTSPLTLPIDIDNCVMQMYDDEFLDCCFTVAPVRYIMWGDYPWGPRGISHNCDLQRPPRQFMDMNYVETGACYVMRTAGFKEAKNRFFGKMKLSFMPRSRFFEVDEQEDFDDARIRDL